MIFQISISSGIYSNRVGAFLSEDDRLFTPPFFISYQPTEFMVSRYDSVFQSYQSQWQTPLVVTTPVITHDASEFLSNTSTSFSEVGALPSASTIELVSVSSNGTQGVGGAYGAIGASISADGRFVTFMSDADNLVANDTNGTFDIFVHNRLTGVTERVSVASDGSQADSNSYYSSISADGRFVVFSSHADTLVANDTNGIPDIFVHDRLTGVTERVSVASDGSQANDGIGAYEASISADGRFVVFVSYAALVANDTNRISDVFVHDRQTGVTERVSVASDGSQANRSFGDFNPSLSADGRFVTFSSEADNLVANDTNEAHDIFVHDRQTGVTERVSVASDGLHANSWSFDASISADGRFVTFKSFASNLVENDTNGNYDIFVHDRQTGVTERVSVASDGSQGVGGAYGAIGASISADGRFVAFVSSASNLVANDTNGKSDIFVHDRQTGMTERVSVASDGSQANGHSLDVAISDDGKFITFSSLSTNLVSGGTNGNRQIYVVENSLFESVLPVLEKSQTIFDIEGKAAFLSELSLAAYYLDLPREKWGDKINDKKPYTDTAYTSVQDHIQLLDSSDIYIGNTLPTEFGTNGFENGIFTRKNAAALVGRSDDALFLSFRGTNDNEGEAGLPTNTPDEHHWIGKDDHFKLFTQLIKGIAAYVKANGIDTIYLTGHSLGASMAEAFMSTEWVQDLYSGINLEAINFASPGYEFGLFASDSRTTTFWIKGDKILLASKTADNIGDSNKIFHNIDTYILGLNVGLWGTNNELHSMKLHSDFIKFFNANGLDDNDFRDLNGINFDRIYAFVEVVNTNTGKYKIGTGADTIEGTWKNEIILGGKNDDILKGKGGKDYLDGGTDSDKLYGGSGRDYLTGGKGKDLLWGDGGKDTFVFQNILETNSLFGTKYADRIKDFDVGGFSDKIDVSGIDAKKGVKDDQEFSFIGDTAFTGTEGELRYSQNSSNTIIRGDRNGDGVADFIIVVEGLHDLQENDFIL